MGSVCFLFTDTNFLKIGITKRLPFFKRKLNSCAQYINNLRQQEITLNSRTNNAGAYLTSHQKNYRPPQS